MIKSLKASAYKVPTDSPEADGTIEWNSTTLVLVEIEAGGVKAIGYSYGHAAAVSIIETILKPSILGADPMDIAKIWQASLRAIRNIGRSGIAASALSAVDNALWDLKAKLLGLPLAKLLGMVRDGIPAYGSGGFTSYNKKHLQKQLGDWAEQGLKMVKMKIGTDPSADLERVMLAREAIGRNVGLFVDANGAYSAKQALKFAEAFEEFDVAWFEEPVSSDDLEGLAFIRSRAPSSMEIAAGEYGDSPFYFQKMLAAKSVDVLQADATRRLGISGFLSTASLCDAFQIPLSAHTAPSVHIAACCAAERAVHLEYFHDHVRIEKLLFDGVVLPKKGELKPDLSRLGLGIEFKSADAERFLVRN